MIKNIILMGSFLSIIFFMGCSTVSLWSNKIWTEEEWTKLTSREFQRKTSKEALEAAQKVLILDDKKDISVYNYPNKIVASRRYFAYAVIAASYGTYTFDIQTQEKDDNTVVRLIISSSESASSAAVIPGIAGGYSNPQVVPTSATVYGQIIERKADYDLFFSRVESLLYGKPWIICDRCQDYIKGCNGDRESLCFHADDNVPEGIPIAGGPIPKYEKLQQNINQFSR